MSDCIVIGAGLSGLTAALTLAQRRVGVEVIATSATETRAGRLGVTTCYPGGSVQASGHSLVEHIADQYKELRGKITIGTVQSVAAASNNFELTLANGEKTSCKGLIVASGIKHHGHPALPGEDPLFGKGVLYNLLVDGPLYAGKTLVAAGKALAVVEDLIACHRWFEKIYLVVPATKLELSDDLQQRLQRCSAIEIIYSASIKEIQGLAEVGSVMIQAAGKDRQLHAQAVWLPTHTHFGNTGFLEGVVTLSETQTPLVNQQLVTSQPGIFACGDVLCADYQHLSITAAQGVIAAYSCAGYLKDH